MDFPMKNDGSFHSYVNLPEGSHDQINRKSPLLLHGVRTKALIMWLPSGLGDPHFRETGAVRPKSGSRKGYYRRININIYIYNGYATTEKWLAKCPTTMIFTWRKMDRKVLKVDALDVKIWSPNYWMVKKSVVPVDDWIVQLVVS